MNKPRSRCAILEFTEGVLSICPYQWQRKTLCQIEAGHPTALVAANGSGKTSTILVPAALWALFNWPLARVIVTSASWSQLKKQFFEGPGLAGSIPIPRYFDVSLMRPQITVGLNFCANQVVSAASFRVASLSRRGANCSVRTGPRIDVVSISRRTTFSNRLSTSC